MFRMIVLFAILLGSVYAGVYFSNDPGLLSIIVKDYTIQMTVWTAAIIVLALFVIFHISINFLSWCFSLPKRWRRSKNRKRIRRARRRTQEGLIEFSEGYWQQARQDLIRAIPHNDKPLLNYLTAARAAQNMDDLRLRDDYLREAQHAIPDAKIAIALTQAELQLDAHQWEQALATLCHLKELAPKHPYVLKLLQQLYQQVRDWQQLLKLLPRLKKLKLIDRIAYDKLSLYAWREMVSDMARTSSIETMAGLINQVPKSWRYDVEINIRYVRFLFDHGATETAEQILHQCLSKQYQDKWVLLFRHCPASDRQLDFLETFLKSHSSSAALYLVLADRCMQLHFWGKAREYLEYVLSMQPDDPDTCLLAGQLYEQLQEPTRALQQYRRGLEITRPNRL